MSSERVPTIRYWGERDLRCLVTGHICGTDTWMVGGGCECEACLVYAPLKTRWSYNKHSQGEAS
jgi:hypothetical protein